jgi:hypothetical protein
MVSKDEVAPGRVFTFQLSRLKRLDSGQVSGTLIPHANARQVIEVWIATARELGRSRVDLT